MNITTIGIDLAKNVFSLHGMDSQGKVRMEKAASRSKLLECFVNTEDQSLAIDGKTMCNAVDKTGRQTHIMHIVAHDTVLCISQENGILPVEGGFDPKQTNEIGTFIPLLESIDIQGKVLLLGANKPPI